ncbi:DUF4276 family protein [Candidatus Palauibacter sp.]|uniref:DUF4276 family protein n=1 Tax=Candidatus Palauibacter sp. TaxID=3101350 RepID=UPI003B5C888D
MTRLIVHVEGQTEEQFVNELLAPHLYDHGYASVGARLLGNARQRGRRGGVKSWQVVRKEITDHLKEDHGSLAATMVDYYGLPQSGPEAWPGRDAASGLPYPENVAHVEEKLLRDVTSEMGHAFNPSRFIPFVMIHEFEALLFSDCQGFAEGIGQETLASDFQAIRDAFPGPEEIDDSPLTAPSKRITKLVPGYQKPLMGVLAALEIGLETMRSECPHFDEWLKRLETALR